MNDDEQAQAVLDALAGVRRCPECGELMRYVHYSNGIGGYMIWICWTKEHRISITDESTVEIDDW